MNFKRTSTPHKLNSYWKSQLSQQPTHHHVMNQSTNMEPYQDYQCRSPYRRQRENNQNSRDILSSKPKYAVYASHGYEPDWEMSRRQIDDNNSEFQRKDIQCNYSMAGKFHRRANTQYENRNGQFQRENKDSFMRKLNSDPFPLENGQIQTQLSRKYGYNIRQYGPSTNPQEGYRLARKQVQSNKIQPMKQLFRREPEEHIPDSFEHQESSIMRSFNAYGNTKDCFLAKSRKKSRQHYMLNENHKSPFKKPGATQRGIFDDDKQNKRFYYQQPQNQKEVKQRTKRQNAYKSIRLNVGLSQRYDEQKSAKDHSHSPIKTVRNQTPSKRRIQQETAFSPLNQKHIEQTSILSRSVFLDNKIARLQHKTPQRSNFKRYGQDQNQNGRENSPLYSQTNSPYRPESLSSSSMPTESFRQQAQYQRFGKYQKYQKLTVTMKSEQLINHHSQNYRQRDIIEEESEQSAYSQQSLETQHHYQTLQDSNAVSTISHLSDKISQRINNILRNHGKA